MQARSRGGFVALLIASLLLPSLAAPATAHGADTYWVILRTSRTDPTEVQVLTNDSIEFRNVADANRTVFVDRNMDGAMDGVGDFTCEAPADGYCSLWLEPANWSIGLHSVEVVENGTLVLNATIDIRLDQHIEPDGPVGYSFGGPGDAEPEVEADSERPLSNAAISAGVFAILLFTAWIGMQARRR